MKKNEKNASTKTANQAVEATSTEQAALTTTETDNLELAAKKLEEAQQTVKLLKAVLKDKKKAKVKTPCAKAGCKLFAMEGRADGMCSNHRPEWDKLSPEEQHVFTEAFSFWKAEDAVAILGAHMVKQDLKK